MMPETPDELWAAEERRRVIARMAAVELDAMFPHDDQSRDELWWAERRRRRRARLAQLGIDRLSRSTRTDTDTDTQEEPDVEN